MLLATVCVGDMWVSVIRITPLAPRFDELGELDVSDVLQVHFRDIATGNYSIIDTKSEHEALSLLAAWIAADETNIGDLESHRSKLERLLPKFLLP